MAIPFEVQIGRVGRFLQKWSGLKGSFRTTIGQEIAPELPIWSGNENRILESWHLYASSVAPAAGGASTFGTMRLRNPTGSKVIAVIFSITSSALLADTPVLNYGAAATDQATIATPLLLDGRQGGTSSVMIPSTGTPLIGGTINLPGKILAFGASGSVEFIPNVNSELPLLPGFAYEIRTGTSNQAGNFAMWWRERVLEDAELVA